MKTKVFTKQHENVLNILNEYGRYTAKKEYIIKDLEEHADIVLESYDWYVKRVCKKYPKPDDVTYPVWVSLSMERAMLPGSASVIMELEIDDEIIMPVNINKWSTILNYGYIPQNNEDELRHKKLLQDYNTTDAKAYMTQFFPQIKREIIESWDRLFDENIIIHNDMKYGTIWELRKEWIVKIIQ